MILGLDPLYVDGVGLAEVLITLGKVLVAFLVLLLSVIFMVWFERKTIAIMQNRVGPNRAGPFGLLQTLADGMKLFFKEDLIPSKARRFVFVLAPYLSVIPAFAVFAVVPLGGTFTSASDAGVIEIAGHETFAQVADPPIGILWILMVSSIGVYGVMLAGWASGSKYPLLGSVRATAQMVSYEAAMGLSIATLIMVSGGLSTRNIVAVQAGDGFGLLPNWNVLITGFVPFAIFFIAALAETNRPPFDLVEAEQEIVGGFHTEYSSIRFGMFFVAEFMHPVTMSAVIVTLWFGGPAGPLLPGLLEPISGIVWLVAKIFVFLYIFVLIRGTLPRFRYDQLMDLGWKVLIPLQLGWLLLLASLNIGRDLDWNAGVVIAVGFFVVGGLSFLLLTRASQVSTERRLAGEVEV